MGILTNDPGRAPTEVTPLRLNRRALQHQLRRAVLNFQADMVERFMDAPIAERRTPTPAGKMFTAGNCDG